jgi:MtN3 and saliva related transmembrane protein
MDYIELLGFLAAILTTIANFPQAYKIIRTRNTRDISPVTYSMLLVGMILWIIYGIIQNDLPIIVGNSIAAFTSAVILFLKFTSRKVIDIIHETVIPESKDDIEKPANT